MARGRVRVEDSPRWIRGLIGDTAIVDSTRAKYVWEVPYYPQYYVPAEDVDMSALTETGERRRSPSRGEAVIYFVGKGEAWTYPDSPIEALRGLVRFEWHALERWFEEDEEVYVHPRDPNTRVDAMPSSRHIQVEIDGVIIADTHRPTLLFETGLPTRYYIPSGDVRMDLFQPTDSRTGCPYKGFANYWSVETESGRHDDIAWSYADPLPESAPIKGLLAFWNEKVDLIIDGEHFEEKG